MAAAEVATSSLAPQLDAILLQLGLPLPADARRQLLAYLSLLGQWNKTYNLTSIRDPQAMLVQHVADCLATIEPLRREAAQSADRRLLDVGSGAGLPGVVIAIAAPEFAVTCIDSVGKKAAFISHVAGALALRGLRAVHGRVESLGDGPFDIVGSRAFSALSTFVDSTRPLLAPGGVWMAMKGKPPLEELAALDPAQYRFHVEPLSVPELDADRCIAWIRRIPESEHKLT